MVQSEPSPAVCASADNAAVAMKPRDEDAADAASNQQHVHGDDAEPDGGSARLGGIALH